MRHGHYKAWVALGLAVAMVAGGCGSDDDDGQAVQQNDTTTAVAQNDTATTAAQEDSATTAAQEDSATTAAQDDGTQPVTGGSVTMLMVADTSSFDAARMATGTVGHEAQLVYDHLFYFDKDLQPQPGLALSATVDEPGKVWTIKLRPDVKFSDGTPFNADAVAAHFERVKNADTGSPAQGSAAQIDSMTVVDDLTLEVTLVNSDYSWNYALGAEANTGGLTLIPSPTAVEKFGDEYGTSPETTVGAGPFLLKEWVPGDFSRFERNPDYWDAPKPYLDEFTYKVIGDETTRYNTFVAGEVEMMYSVGALTSLADLAANYPTGIGPFAGAVSMYFNMSSAPTDDVRVREALSIGADLDAVVELVAEGSLTAPKYLFPPDGPFGNDVELPPYDPERAAMLIEEYLADTGGSTVDVIIRGNTAHTDVATALKQYYDQIPGLNVTLGLEPSETREANRDYEAVFMSAFPELPRALVPHLMSTSKSNLSYLADDEIDAALVAATGTTDISEQAAAMEVIAERFNVLFPLRPVYNTLRQWNWQESVQGVQVTADASVVSQELWLQD